MVHFETEDTFGSAGGVLGAGSDKILANDIGSLARTGFGWGFMLVMLFIREGRQILPLGEMTLAVGDPRLFLLKAPYSISEHRGRGNLGSERVEKTRDDQRDEHGSRVCYYCRKNVHSKLGYYWNSGVLSIVEAKYG